MSFLIDLFSWVLLLGGSFFCLTTALAFWRMPDFYTRMHGASCQDTLGAGLILAGCFFQTTDPLIMLKLVFIYFFLMITGPTSSHALTRTALLKGNEPTNCDPVPLKGINIKSQHTNEETL